MADGKQDTALDDRVMPRTLSSRWTFIQKWVFPIVWSGGFGFILLQMFLHPETFVYNGVKGGVTRSSQLLFIGAWLIGTAMAVAFGWRLKRVRVDGADLVVSNYLREIRVPLTNVRSVEDQFIRYFPQVYVEFIAPTPMGRRISLLRRLVAEAKSNDGHSLRGATSGSNGGYS
jgi:hypothetical protein